MIRHDLPLWSSLKSTEHMKYSRTSKADEGVSATQVEDRTKDKTNQKRLTS
jgi:hypothetical protein